MFLNVCVCSTGWASVVTAFEYEFFNCSSEEILVPGCECVCVCVHVTERQHVCCPQVVVLGSSSDSLMETSTGVLN